MTRLEDLLIGIVLAVLLALGAWRGVIYYGGTRYDAGYDAAVAASQKLRDHEADESRKTESDLRAQLAERDAEAHRKEIEHAQDLADAQRRVRAGTDRLRCPSASPVQPTAAAGDRPAAGTPAADGAGQDLVPEAAADVLGHGAAIASLVSRYAEVIELYDICRSVNARP